MRKLKQTLLGSLISLGLLFSLGCSVAPNSELGQIVKLIKGEHKKANSYPPPEKCLFAIPYRRDSRGHIEFLETEETYKASQERLVPYNGKWIPWKEKDKLLRGRLAELESQLKYSEFALSKVQRENLEKLRKYEVYEIKTENLSEFERMLGELEREVIRPTLEAKLKYERAKEAYRSEK